MDETQRRLASLKAQLYRLSREQHEYEQAVVVGEEALRLSNELKGDGDPSSFAILNNLATAYQHLRQYDRAEALFRDALRFAEPHFDKDAPERLALVNNCADVCRLAGKLEDAEAFYQQLDRALLRTVGANHPNYALTLTGRALIREAAGDITESVRLLRRATDIFRDAFGANHPQYLQSLWNLAMVHRHHGEPGAAEPFLEEVARLAPEVMGARDPLTAQALAELTRVRMEVGTSDVMPQAGMRQPSPADWQRCMGHFEARDYTGCLRAITPFLETGAPASLMLLAMVCLKRLGRDWQEFVATLSFMGVLCDDEWESTLVRMAMGALSPDEALALADTAVRACQGRYYVAALACTDDLPRARALLQACLTPALDCREQRMARIDLREIAPAAVIHPEPEPEHIRPVETCIDAFRRRDYGTCAAIAQDLSHKGAPFGFWLLVLICLDRLGRRTEAAFGAAQCLAATAQHPWEHELTRLMIGQTDGETIVARARTEIEWCQAHFYAASRALALGDSRTAERHLDICGENEVGCLEYALAAIDLDNLKRLEPPCAQPRRSQQLHDQLVDGRRLHAEGRYGEARAAAAKAYRLALHELPEGHPDQASAANNLAEACRAMGDLASAEPLYDRARDILSRTAEADPASYAGVLNNTAELYRAQARFAEAATLYEQARDIFVRLYGRQHLTLATTSNNLGELQRALGNEAAAQAHYRAALTSLPPLPPHQRIHEARMLMNLGRSYLAMGDASEAERCQARAQELFRSDIGEEHPDYALWLMNQASIQIEREQLAPAESLLRHGIALTKKHFGEAHPYYAAALNNLAVILRRNHDLRKAERVLREVREINRRALGEGHPENARTLLNLAIVLSALQRNEEAERLFEDALSVIQGSSSRANPQVVEMVVGVAEELGEHGNHRALQRGVQFAAEFVAALPPPDDAALGRHLVSMGSALLKLGDLAEAQRVLRRAAAALADAPVRDRLRCVNALAMVREAMGEYGAASELSESALDLAREHYGESSVEYAAVLTNRAAVDVSEGDLSMAVTRLGQALAIREECDGKNDLEYAQVLANLGNVHAARAEHNLAEQRLLEALEIRERCLDTSHPECARTHKHLGQLFHQMGLLERAVQHLRNAQSIQLESLGPQHPDYTNTLNSLALCYLDAGDARQAEQMLEDALSARVRTLGEGHPDTVPLLLNIASVKASQRDYEAAASLNRRALEARRKTFGEKHIQCAICLNNLGMVHVKLGELDAGRRCLDEARDLRRAALGETHPDYLVTTTNLALLCLDLGRHDEAFTLLKEVVASEEPHIGQLFRSATDDERLRGLRQVRAHTDLFLALVRRHLSHSQEAIVSAFELVLRRKMLTQDALAARNDLMFKGRYPELMPWLRELAHIRGLMARDATRGRAFESVGLSIQKMRESRQEELERMLARNIPEMDLARKLGGVNRDAVAGALPEDSVLVEFYRCEGVSGGGMEEGDRYLAFVAPARRPDAIRMIDVGEADSIDRLIAEFRAAILRSGRSEPNSGSDAAVDRAGHALRAVLLDPIVPLLQGRTRLLIAADGELCLLPIEALPTTSGRYVIDDYRVSYLSCGRDVMRFTLRTNPERHDPLVMADPDFDLTGLPDQPSTRGGPAARWPADPAVRTKHFDRLPGTRAEGERIASMLGVEPWLGEAALEGRLKASPSPQILHLATHGFFLPSRSGPSSIEDLPGARVENPLLRSALALAGANRWLSGLETSPEAEDGLLTAEDVASLDLTDTDLTVLSACETGLGEVRVGEGVFGLRRSFVLAGVQTLVMSMWNVPDVQTVSLMIDFYERILQGAECAHALHEARLALKLREPNPYYWAAFVCEGHPGPLRSVRGPGSYWT